MKTQKKYHSVPKSEPLPHKHEQPPTKYPIKSSPNF